MQRKRHRCLAGSRPPLLSWAPHPYLLPNYWSYWPTANADPLPDWLGTYKGGSYTEATASHRHLDRLNFHSQTYLAVSGCSYWLVMALMLQLLLWTFPSSSCRCVNSNPLSHKTPTLFCWWNHDNYWDKNKISTMESRMSSLIWLDLKGIRDPVFCSKWDHGHPWHNSGKMNI